MPLFTTAELRALIGTISDERADLAHDLTEDAIRGEVGDRIIDPPQPGVKSVALAVAARVLTNPAGVRSEQAGGMLISYADAQTGVALSEDERRRLRRAVGLSSGASMLTIAPIDDGRHVRIWQAP
ncbi:hypothetical protein [Streptomyces albipurpureus]|uniref:Uncharacterized protein n=1 Tax=Streptomyces albipurpureus TaxID=2897419 RepID=A0ABT0USY0_9ACTN|nr:hypothetical protein [Streptomyces sp. CWNU-1]MCM2391708.1 hypothetical protein [Streptomyces sp. CWNU-1]